MDEGLAQRRKGAKKKFFFAPLRLCVRNASASKNKEAD